MLLLTLFQCLAVDSTTVSKHRTLMMPIYCSQINTVWLHNKGVDYAHSPASEIGKCLIVANCSLCLLLTESNLNMIWLSRKPAKLVHFVINRDDLLSTFWFLLRAFFSWNWTPHRAILWVVCWIMVCCICWVLPHKELCQECFPLAVLYNWYSYAELDVCARVWCLAGVMQLAPQSCSTLCRIFAGFSTGLQSILGIQYWSRLRRPHPLRSLSLWKTDK